MNITERFDGSQLKDMTIFRRHLQQPGDAPGGKGEIKFHGQRRFLSLPQIGDPMYSKTLTMEMASELSTMQQDLMSQARKASSIGTASPYEG